MENTVKNYPLDSDFIPDNGRKYTTSNGSQITISKYHIEFFDKLKGMPVLEKIEIMGISLTQIEEYLNIQIKREKRFVLDLINDTWYSKETGDIIKLNDIPVPGSDLSWDEIIRKCKGKSKLQADLLKSINDFFLGDWADIYRKNNNK